MKPSKSGTILGLIIQIILLALLLIVPASPAQVQHDENCDMAAMITRVGYKLSEFNTRPGTFDDPNDIFDFLIQRSTANTNRDGYGVIFAGDDGLFSNPTTANQTEFYSAQAWYVKAQDTNVNTYHYGHYSGPMQSARFAIMDADTGAVVVLGHDRNASSSALGSHPFRFEYTNRVYTFMHNGSIESDIKSALYAALGGAAWFDQHPPNWTVSYGNVANLVDSEVLFHWIMSKVMDHNGDVGRGALEALTATVDGYDLRSEFRQDYLSNVINFVLSDGEVLYLFRNAGDVGPRLSWAEPQPGLFMMKTHSELAHPLEQFDFAVLSRYGQPHIFNDFLNHDLTQFVSGEVHNATWNNRVYITDDVLVPGDVTLTINAPVRFNNHVEFAINGTVNLNAGAAVYLVNASTILVDGPSAVLRLGLGSKISCNTPNTYSPTSSGDNLDRDKAIPGARISTRKGGVITTKKTLPCSPHPWSIHCYEGWSDYYELWCLSQKLRQCSGHWAQ
jgi:hypothetical protein